MVEENGYVYADDRAPVLKIVSADLQEDWMADVRFNDGTGCRMDFGQLLETPAFRPLKDISLFLSGKVMYGTLTWNEGDIDIAPQWVRSHGMPTS